MSNFDQETFRNRIEHEDALLNQRTGLFLTANGLGAVAMGIRTVDDAVSLFLAVVLIINAFWILCGLQSVLVLRRLTRTYVAQVDDRVDELVRDSTSWMPKPLNPSNLLGLFLPIVVFLGWLYGAFFL